jgi:hypothetical protein
MPIDFKMSCIGAAATVATGAFGLTPSHGLTHNPRAMASASTFERSSHQPDGMLRHSMLLRASCDENSFQSEKFKKWADALIARNSMAVRDEQLENIDEKYGDIMVAVKIAYVAKRSNICNGQSLAV